MANDRVIIPSELEAVAENEIRRLANFYDDIANEVGVASRSRESVFAHNSEVEQTWIECSEFYYQILYESSAHIRAVSKFLMHVAEEARTQESELQEIFDEYAEDILSQGSSAPWDEEPPSYPGNTEPDFAT
ncbi:hypothetical protein [Natronoglycomyces albus]|uniref:Uncharacterized protein n=1 Tax=Natronoglycomyces albus TaxID=2811108 RepID=A0A895XR24_9ACTN|nr:hypothetical protein [Natronoglycomyces albus]QSB04720.1 hypothetical protein JQS30_13215 [Natronoglycomyces albus]